MARCGSRRPHGQVTASLLRRMRRVRLIALDVDGVLTEGHLPYAEAGGMRVDSRVFSVKDGLAIAEAQRAGITCAIITSKNSRAVMWRAIDLGLEEVLLAREDKGAALTELLERQGLDPEEAAFFGDDLFDLTAMELAGLAVAPCDAAPEVLAVADFVTAAGGGAGCVREAVRLILMAQGYWEQVVARHREGAGSSAS